MSTCFVQKCAGEDALKAQAMGSVPAEWKTKHLLLKNWLDAIAEELVADPKCTMASPSSSTATPR